MGYKINRDQLCSGPLKGKDLLLAIIKYKGSCVSIIDRCCLECPVIGPNLVCDKNSEEARYKKTIRYYIEEYGKDEDIIGYFMGQDSTQ